MIIDALRLTLVKGIGELSQKRKEKLQVSFQDIFPEIHIDDDDMYLLVDSAEEDGGFKKGIHFSEKEMGLLLSDVESSEVISVIDRCLSTVFELFDLEPTYRYGMEMHAKVQLERSAFQLSKDAFKLQKIDFNDDITGIGLRYFLHKDNYRADFKVEPMIREENALLFEMNCMTKNERAHIDNLGLIKDIINDFESRIGSHKLLF